MTAIVQLCVDVVLLTFKVLFAAPIQSPVSRYGRGGWRGGGGYISSYASKLLMLKVNELHAGQPERKLCHQHTLQLQT